MGNMVMPRAPRHDRPLPPCRHPRRCVRRNLAWLHVLLAWTAMLVPGCAIAGFGGALIESYRRHSTRTVAAEYTGLTGTTWAVLVMADRAIQADFPDLIPALTARITDRLADRPQQETIAAAGYIPADRLLAWLYDNPHWTTLPYGELARRLGVTRLIVIEVIEFRLHEPGNAYLWSGVAAGTVGVAEADSRIPDEFAFQRAVQVEFPDQPGLGPENLPRAAVATELLRRFVDRVSWLFYTHEEPYYPAY